MSSVSKLVAWAVSNGAAINPHIHFKSTEDRGNIAENRDNGADYDNAVGLNDKDIRLPISLSIGPENGIKEFGEELLEKSMNVNSLTKLFLVKERATAGSFFETYIDSLPNIEEIGSPLVWNKPERDYLKGTNLGSSINEKLALLVEEWFSILQNLPDSMVKPESYFVDVKFYYEFKFYKEDEFYNYIIENEAKPENWTNFAHYLWASLIFTSRSFPYRLISKTAKDGQAMLLPVIDLLNHQSNTRVEWGVSDSGSDGSYFEYKSNESLEDGEEMFNNYGFKGNEELLLGYGFTTENNQADSVALRIKVPLELLPEVESFGIKLPDINDFTSFIIADDHKTETSSSYKKYKNGILFFVGVEGVIPQDLQNLFAFLVKSEWESKLTLRMKLDGLTKLRGAIQQKLNILNENDTKNTKTSRNIDNARRYKESQIKIYQKAIKSIKTIEKGLLSQFKSNLVPLKKIMSRDEKFAQSLLVSLGVSSVNQIIESNFEDQTWLLWLIRTYNKSHYTEQDQADNFMPDWVKERFEQLSREYTVTQTDKQQYSELYNALIPQLSKLVPEIYAVGEWGLDQLVISGKLLEIISYTRGKDGELIIVENVEL